MKVDFKNFEEYQSKLGLVFHGTLAVPLLPFALIFLEIKNRGYQGWMEVGTLANVINYGVALVSGLLVAQGFSILKRKLQQAEEKSTLKEKLQLYYSAAVPSAVGLSTLVNYWWCYNSGLCYCFICYVLEPTYSSTIRQNFKTE